MMSEFELPEETFAVKGRHVSRMFHDPPRALEFPDDGAGVRASTPRGGTARMNPKLTYAKDADGTVTLRVDDRDEHTFWLEIVLTPAALAVLTAKEDPYSEVL